MLLEWLSFLSGFSLDSAFFPFTVKILCRHQPPTQAIVQLDSLYKDLYRYNLIAFEVRERTLFQSCFAPLPACFLLTSGWIPGHFEKFCVVRTINNASISGRYVMYGDIYCTPFRVGTWCSSLESYLFGTLYVSIHHVPTQFREVAAVIRLAGS